jgi:hypothetical protein
VIRCTARAVELLRRSSEAARRFEPHASVRLVPEAAGGVRFELADLPAPGDEIVEHEAGFTLFVAAGLSGTVDVADPHDRLVLVTGSDPPGDDT